MHGKRNLKQPINQEKVLRRKEPLMFTVHNGVPKTRLILIVVFLAEQCKIVLQTETSQR